MFKASVFIAGALALANGQDFEDDGLTKSLFTDGVQNLVNKRWRRDTNRLFKACDKDYSKTITQYEFE